VQVCGSEIQKLVQVCGGEIAVFAVNHGCFDGVGELAYVAGPGVRGKEIENIGREVAERAQILSGVQLVEVAGQDGELTRAVAEGRQQTAEDAKAVVEVSAKPLFGDGALEMNSGCCYESEVDALRTFGADPTELMILEDGEELGLETGRKLGDLIEEQGAAVGLLDEAAVRLQCAGEGAADVAEEFGFKQRLGDARAIHGDEGCSGTRAGVVDDASEEAFACAGFSSDEHGRLDGGGAPREITESSR